jgi:hypothetical protein
MHTSSDYSKPIRRIFVLRDRYIALPLLHSQIRVPPLTPPFPAFPFPPLLLPPHHYFHSPHLSLFLLPSQTPSSPI